MSLLAGSKIMADNSLLALFAEMTSPNVFLRDTKMTIMVG